MANEEGLLAIGGDLKAERLLEAYKEGIFPWYEVGQPILWWSPDPRFVLYPEKLNVTKSMSQALRNSNYTVTVNKDFRSVIKECAFVKLFIANLHIPIIFVIYTVFKFSIIDNTIIKGKLK